MQGILRPIFATIVLCGLLVGANAGTPSDNDGPGKLNAALKQADQLIAVEKLEEALGILSELVRANPGQHHLWMQLADAHRQADDAGKAQEAYERVLEQDPKHTQAWLGLSELAMTAGLADEAHDHYRRAAYYGYMEPFDTPLYNEDRYELARLLSDARDEDTAQEVWDARRTEAIEGLITASNDWALLMLAALCWHHWDHGPVEDSAYEAMVQAGEPAVPLLTILAEKAGSKCTIGSACEALARLKAPGTLALLEHYGPQDSDLFFPMDIAQSMAELGDPDAIPALMALAGIGAPAPRPSGINALLGGTGLGDARNRAVLALGSFDHPDAHSALEQALEIPELALCAHAVLAGLSRGKAHRKALFTAHEQEPSYDTARAMRHLADRGNSRAAKLIEAWDEAQSEE